MYIPEGIAKNPFHTLGASTTDGKRRLIERTDEAALLGQAHAEEALNVLLHGNHRLDAEINWFPGIDEATVQAVMDYPHAKSPAAFVSTEGMTPLARLNACRVMLEAWPVTDESSAFALLSAMAQADGAQHAGNLMEQINADRERAGIPPLTSIQATADRLDALRRETAKRLYERISILEEDRMIETLDRAAKQYRQKRSPLLETLIGIYALSMYDRTEKMAEQIEEIQKRIERKTRPIPGKEMDADEMYALLGKWGRLTCPIRRLEEAKGHQGEESRRVYHAVIESVCIMYNICRIVRESLRLTIRMQEVFFNLPDAQVTLEKNRAIIEKAMNQSKK